MKDLLKQWGKHVVALILFLGLVMTYFSPAVFDGKVIMQGDNIKATGMGSSQMDQYAETAQPGEFSVWSDAMFGGMPYVTGYGQAAPGMRRGKGRETRLGVVRGVVAHHHALPLVARKILPHDGFERRNELCGTVVGGNDERDSNHRANVAIYP